MREKYNKWIATLNKFDIAYFEREYIKTNGPDEVDYKDFDSWLFERWIDGN